MKKIFSYMASLICLSALFIFASCSAFESDGGGDVTFTFDGRSLSSARTTANVVQTCTGMGTWDSNPCYFSLLAYTDNTYIIQCVSGYGTTYSEISNVVAYGTYVYTEGATTDTLSITEQAYFASTTSTDFTSSTNAQAQTVTIESEQFILSILNNQVSVEFTMDTTDDEEETRVLKVYLRGDYTASQSVNFSSDSGAMVSFSNIPIGSQIYAVAKYFVMGEYYEMGGKSSSATISSGSNSLPVSLSYNKKPYDYTVEVYFENDYAEYKKNSKYSKSGKDISFDEINEITTALQETVYNDVSHYVINTEKAYYDDSYEELQKAMQTGGTLAEKMYFKKLDCDYNITGSGTTETEQVYIKMRVFASSSESTRYVIVRTDTGEALSAGTCTITTTNSSNVTITYQEDYTSTDGKISSGGANGSISGGGQSAVEYNSANGTFSCHLDFSA